MIGQKVWIAEAERLSSVPSLDKRLFEGSITGETPRQWVITTDRHSEYRVDKKGGDVRKARNKRQQGIQAWAIFSSEGLEALKRERDQKMWWSHNRYQISTKIQGMGYSEENYQILKQIADLIGYKEDNNAR